MKIGSSLDAITGRDIDMERPQDSLVSLFFSVLQMVEQCDLRLFEFPLDAVFIYPPLFTEDSLNLIRQLAQEHSLEFTMHLPFMWLDLSSINEGMRRASVRCVLEGLEIGRRLDPLGYSIHLFGERAKEVLASGWEEEEKRAFLNRMVQQAGRSLSEIAQAVEPKKLCLENSEGVPLGPITSLATEQGTSLCLDVGHLVLQGEDVVAAIQKHFDAIKIIHLHDITPKGDVLKDHQPLGSGFLPLREILHILRTKSYEGVLLVETTRREHLIQSIKVLRSSL